MGIRYFFLCLLTRGIRLMITDHNQVVVYKKFKTKENVEP